MLGALGVLSEVCIRLGRQLGPANDALRAQLHSSPPLQRAYVHPSRPLAL